MLSNLSAWEHEFSTKNGKWIKLSWNSKEKKALILSSSQKKLNHTILIKSQNDLSKFKVWAKQYLASAGVDENSSFEIIDETSYIFFR